MKSINFEFLRSHKEELTYIGALAEASLYHDPSNSLAKARIFAERSVELIYREYGLQLPNDRTLLTRLSEDSFRNFIPIAILDKFHIVRVNGNKGAHDFNAKTLTAEMTLRETFDIARWLFATIYNGNAQDVAAFQVPPNPQNQTAELQKNQRRQNEKIAAQEAELQVLLEKLEAANAKAETRTASGLNEIANAGKRASDALNFSEAETRKRLVDVMLIAAGWDLNDADEVGQEVTLKNGERADYALFGDDGKPLAVIEAKKTSVNAETGRTQAKIYADQLERQTGQRPVIFYTNGFETFIWNDAASETPRRIYGFYSKDSLEYLIFKRKNRLPLTDVQPDSKIAGRIYQLEAIKRVTESFERNKRKVLIVQATGTGKTRVAVSLCELLYRARHAKRILFLCDRRELRKQADDVFKEFMQGEPRAIVSAATAEDRDKRIYLATYPAMTGIFERFDVGFFDLIIADESHRSIYNRYRDLFLYFDAPQIGLTATPVNFINRSTFDIFDCENGDPTANYEYEDAVAEKYLVPFEPFNVTTDFMRRGIKYRQLNEEQREQLEESEEDAETFDYKVEQINKLVFNRPTNEFILRNLMEKGLREKSGQTVGKSIIFARNHNHAVFLQTIFDELYPQYGGTFCRVIDSHDARADELLTEFKKPDSKLTVAISVDMLDTGIDIPEIVNLVFAKPVKSYVKFWQMIGRGTRLCEYIGKTKFHIFDHCGNFEFFEQSYKEVEPQINKPLLQKLFESRIELAKTALAVQNAETFNHATELLAQDIAALPENSISVREKLREVLEVKRDGVLQAFAPDTIQTLTREIAPLMQWRSIAGKEKPYEFDLLMTRTQTEKLKNSGAFADLRDAARNTVSQLPINLNAVREKSDLINNVKNLGFWENADNAEIESIRVELRGLMNLLSPSIQISESPRITNITEDAEKFEHQRITPKLEGLSLVAYKHRVQSILESLIETSAALQKVKKGERLDAKDFDELCKLVLAQDPELNLRDLQRYYPDLTDNLDIALRSVIGLNAETVNSRFEDFVQRNNLNSKQIRFLSLLKNHLTKYGTIEIARLYESPFTEVDGNGLDGVFNNNEMQINELINILQTNNLVN